MGMDWERCHQREVASHEEEPATGTPQGQGPEAWDEEPRPRGDVAAPITLRDTQVALPQHEGGSLGLRRQGGGGARWGSGSMMGSTVGVGSRGGVIRTLAVFSMRRYAASCTDELRPGEGMGVVRSK
jgi:hypothetical protein